MERKGIMYVHKPTVKSVEGGIREGRRGTPRRRSLIDGNLSKERVKRIEKIGHITGGTMWHER